MCSSVYSQAINSAIFKNDINTAIISSLDDVLASPKTIIYEKKSGKGKRKSSQQFMYCISSVFTSFGSLFFLLSSAV